MGRPPRRDSASDTVVVDVEPGSGASTVTVTADDVIEPSTDPDDEVTEVARPPRAPAPATERPPMPGGRERATTRQPKKRR